MFNFSLKFFEVLPNDGENVVIKIIYVVGVISSNRVM